MQLVLRMGIKRLLLVVGDISDKGLSVVLDKRVTERCQTIVVKLADYDPTDLKLAQEDICLLTGGMPIQQGAGESLDDATESHFGWARWVWADDKNFGFASGGGDRAYW